MTIVDTEEKGVSDSICKGADTFKTAFSRNINFNYF